MAYLKDRGLPINFYARQTMKKLQIDPIKKDIVWNSQRPDFTCKFDDITEGDPLYELIQKYEKKKAEWQKHKHSKNALKIRLKNEKKLKNAYTLEEIALMWSSPDRKVSSDSVRMKLKKGWFPKKYIFKDMFGKIRIDLKGIHIAEKRLILMHNRKI